MTIDLDSLADAPKIVRRQVEGAVERARRESALRTAITKTVLGDRPTRLRIGHIVTVEPDPEFVEGEGALGSYVVEMIRRIDRDTEVSVWATVHEGVSDLWRWFTVDQALLHLIALRHGRGEDARASVTYASRVIGFNDTPAGD